VRRFVPLLAVAAAALAVGAAPASATNECRGLMVCVPVAGPWVVVPTARTVPRPRVEYQLSCPRGYIVGGLDAELSDRAIDIGFHGTLGSPVNPGITTARDAVFAAAYAGSSPHVPSFRPHIGCIPASGGGGIPTLAAAVVPPGKPTARRVKNVDVVRGRARRVVQGCAAGERLVAGSHAVGFETADPPADRLARSVTATRTVRGGSVVVTVRAVGALAGEQAVLQVGAVCAGGQ
jgi:hypothetical protein